MRLIGILLGLLLAQPVWAEWVRIGTVGSGTSASMTTYWDPATVRKTADGRRIWTITSFEKPQTQSFGTFLSRKDLIEYDCVGERVRSLAGSAHSGQMGSGEYIFGVDTPSEWSFVSPETVDAARLKATCRLALPK